MSRRQPKLASAAAALSRAAVICRDHMRSSRRNRARMGFRDRCGLSVLDEIRLKLAPRYKHMSVSILGRRLELTDPYWYLYCYREICRDEIYRFAAASNNPLIIDCGANIGVSVIYFKHLYPSARIIAFEPDAEIFEVLGRNVKALGLQNVTLYRNAVWKSHADLLFRPDGSVGGRLEPEGRGDRLVRVEAVRLRDFLHQPVDFLKVDVEGAEYEVIMDCRDVLGNVEHLFVEYHARSGEPQQLGEILEALRLAGFRYHIKEANPIDHPFLETERHPGYDLQLNIFGFRNQG